MKIWRKRMTELMSNEAVCRTAPATPGLLINIWVHTYGTLVLGISTRIPSLGFKKTSLTSYLRTLWKPFLLIVLVKFDIIYLYGLPSTVIVLLWQCAVENLNLLFQSENGWGPALFLLRCASFPTAGIHRGNRQHNKIVCFQRQVSTVINNLLYNINKRNSGV